MNDLTIGEIFLLRRKRMKLSQSEVANLAGVSRNYVAMIERGFGGAKLSVYAKIAEALKCQMKIDFIAHSEDE